MAMNNVEDQFEQYVNNFVGTSSTKSQPFSLHPNMHALPLRQSITKAPTPVAQPGSLFSNFKIWGLVLIGLLILGGLVYYFVLPKFMNRETDECDYVNDEDLSLDDQQEYYTEPPPAPRHKRKTRRIQEEYVKGTRNAPLDHISEGEEEQDEGVYDEAGEYESGDLEGDNAEPNGGEDREKADEDENFTSLEELNNA